MLYCDTSILVPLFLHEATSGRVERFFSRQPEGELSISHWSCIEFSSLLARDVRMGLFSSKMALEIDTEFEAMVAASFFTILPTINDFSLARQFLQRHETKLRGGDALHLAIASNHGARAIYSLDQGVLKAGRLLGLPVDSGIRLP